jgi:hypothetical protein
MDHMDGWNILILTLYAITQTEKKVDIDTGHSRKFVNGIFISFAVLLIQFLKLNIPQILLEKTL